MRPSRAAVCAAMMLSCGSNLSVSGTLDGGSFVALGSVAFRPERETCTHDGTTGPVLLRYLLLTSATDTATLQANACTSRASSRSVEVYLFTFAASGDVAPATIALHQDSSGGLAAFWWRTDAACEAIGDNVLSTAGQLVLEANDATHLAGTIDLTFPGGDHLAGRFDAPVVPSPYGTCEAFGWPGGSPGPGCPAPVCVP